jgi:hypothetical protein
MRDAKRTKLLLEEMEGRPVMEHSPEYSVKPLPCSADGPTKPGKSATLVYQCVTIAAMLLLLGSLWVF